MNRWDDARREFRTLYAAETALTALVEVFQVFRPNVQAQRTRGQLYPSKYLLPSEDLHPGRAHLQARLGPSKWSWRALVRVEPEADGRVLDLTGPDRGWVEREATDLLAKYGRDSADTHALTYTNRECTQELTRLMYDRGIAGVRYPSNVAEDACLALFEGRGRLRPVGEARPPASRAARPPELEEEDQEQEDEDEQEQRVDDDAQHHRDHHDEKREEDLAEDAHTASEITWVLSRGLPARRWTETGACPRPDSVSDALRRRTHSCRTTGGGAAA